MKTFSSAHVTGADWQAVCAGVLDRIDGDNAGDLAFIYLSEDLAADTDRIIDELREQSGITHWVGCVGMGLCSNGRETYGETAASVLVTPFAADDFRLMPPIEHSPSEWLSATERWRNQSLASVAVVHGDPSSSELPDLLVRVSDGLQGGFLVGGIASADKLPVQIADKAVSGGLSGVLFSGNITVNTGLSQGCSLIGDRHQIDAGQRNIIESIDGQPALDVFKEEIGEVLARDLRRVGGYIFVALPIAGSDTGDYLVRNLIGIDPDQGLLAIGDYVKPGMEIQFARRDANTARDDLQQMIEGLLQRLPSPPRGALYHSCLGRGRNQFGDDSEELKLIGELLGDVPLAGFYANGEISHHRLYGYTGVLTLFS